MSEPYIGQVCMFAGNFAPRGWMFCQGQLLAISTNTALFSILGTTYGGNGQTTFALPDLRGRFPTNPGTGPGLSTIMPGQMGGIESETLTIAQLPAHNHAATLTASGASSIQVAGTGSGASTTPSATNNVLGASVAGGAPSAAIWSDALNDPVTLANPVSLNAGVTVGVSGMSQPVPVRNPYLGINFIIAVEGIFPPRN